MAALTGFEGTGKEALGSFVWGVGVSEMQDDWEFVDTTLNKKLLTTDC